jgi:hypothetical protein
MDHGWALSSGLALMAGRTVERADTGHGLWAVLELLGEDLAVLAPDLPGHGELDAPPGCTPRTSSSPRSSSC